MKDPGSYFNTRKENGHYIYEWFSSARAGLVSVAAIILIVTSFVSAFIDHTVPVYLFFIACFVGISIATFFFIYDRFRLVINEEGIYVARGPMAFFSKSYGKLYAKKDIEKCFMVSPWDYFSEGNVIIITPTLYALLKNGRKIKLTGSLAEDNAKYLRKEIKAFLPFGDNPKRPPLTTLPKLLIALVLIVVAGSISPRLLEVGEYAIEKQSNAMRFASGLLSMGFGYWIVTATHLLFQKGELSSSQRIMLFIASFILTAGVLYYLYLKPQ
ncbi:MAG: hypothetical protein RIB47_01330 [Cyclobacteriaceae bacterium]